MDTKAYNQTNYVQAIYVQVPISTSNVQNATSLEFSSSACLQIEEGGMLLSWKIKTNTTYIILRSASKRPFVCLVFAFYFFTAWPPLQAQERDNATWAVLDSERSNRPHEIFIENRVSYTTS